MMVDYESLLLLPVPRETPPKNNNPEQNDYKIPSTVFHMLAIAKDAKEKMLTISYNILCLSHYA